MGAITNEKGAESLDSNSGDSTTPKPVEPSAFKGYMRVFTYCGPIECVLELIGVLAAIGSGVALAMVNLVLGEFMSILSNATMDGPMPDNFMSEVSKHSLYFVYIGIARFAFTYIYSTLLTYVGLRITRNIRYQYLKSALSQEVSFFDQGTGGSVSMQATSNGKLIQSGVGEKLGQVVQAVATFVAAFVIAFVSQWKLTLILLCILPALLLIVGVVAIFDAAIDSKILKTYSQAGSFVESVLGNVRAMHAFGLGQSMTDRYTTYLQDANDLGQKKSLLYGLMFAGEYFVIFAGMGLAFWQGIAMISRGEVESVGTIFTVLFSVIIAAAIINSIAPHMITFGRAATAATELFSLVDRQSDIDPFSTTGDSPDNVMGAIELENVNFCYPTRPNVRVLNDYSIRVPAGKVTALVGASGSGKSTIIGLLERWYNPGSGSIKLDGTPIEKLNLKWLRTNIRLVQQEPVLFNGTVFDNISQGLVGTPWEQAKREEKLRRVQSAARTAFAHDFIEALPHGYDTRIGERGGLLSGGQKQRVAIARSIISEPRILLLDEATSALDPHAEQIVQQALDEASKNRTTIVIAHKLKTIRDADNIVVMKQGGIIEQGRHAELLAADGAYAKLVKAQDLSPKGKPDDTSSGQSSDADEEEHDEAALKKTQSLARRGTAASAEMAPLRDREDYNLHTKTGVVRTMLQLVAATPEINAWYILIVVTSIIGAAVYPGQALLLGNIMDVFGAEDMQSRGNFISLMFFVMALGLLLVYGTLGWATNVVAQLFSMVVRRDMFAAMMRQDLQFFDRPENTVGALTSRIETNAGAIFELMGFSIAIILICVITILVTSVLSIAVSWKLGLVGVFAGIPPLLFAGYLRIRVETKMDHETDKRYSTSASVASETIMAIRTVSSLALEEDVLRRYAFELDSAGKESKGPLFMLMIFFSLTQSVEYFILGLGFWWGSKLVNDGDITFYQFMVSFMGVYFAGQNCGLLFGYASSFTKANSAANYFFWLKNIVPTVRETPENKDVAPHNGCRSYSFNKVEFAYPLAPRNQVLKGISLKIEPGQFVAFVGASGCGKSTMIALLERYYDPMRGSIIIDEHDDLTNLNPSTYRGMVSLVQQEPTLFPGSIRENVAMGIEGDASDMAIENACRAANAWDFVSSLPDGLNTPCGTGGSQLSGGQRQRIAIARALIRDPRVILLDEATSALDTESERVVQRALMGAATAGDRITIAVAHRLSTIRDADRIFVFLGGRILEAGTHQELVSLGGMYRKMCEAQSLDTAI